MKLRAYLKNLALYGGLTKEEYRSVEGTIQKKNRETLLLSALLVSIMFLGLLTGSFFSSAMAEARDFYAAMLIVCVAVCLLTFTLSVRRSGLILPLWYLLFFAFGSYAVTLNTFVRSELSATTLCVFLVAGPLLIIDRPLRVVGFQLALSLVYMVCALQTKAPYLFFADNVNVICCVFLGAAIYTRINRVKLREAMQSELLQTERDTDKLTELLNKAAVEEKIRVCLSDPQRRGALVILDIDDFKHINDSYGHAFGDFVIRQTAAAIRRTVGEESLCGRFGGDEFLLFLPDLSREALEKQLDAMLAGMKAEIVLPNSDDAFGVSIGAALFPEAGEDYEVLFRSADTALYEAKTAGKKCWRVRP